MGRTTWLIGQNLGPEEVNELAERWMESMKRLAHSELMNFDRSGRIRIHMDIETGILAADVMMELREKWQRVEGGRDGFCRLCREMIRNDLLNYAKKIKAQFRAPYVNRESLDIAGDNLRQDPEVDLEVSVKWLYAALERMEAELPDIAAVIHRRFSGEESLRVIAQAVSKSPDTVSRLIKQGLAWLAEEG